MKRHAANVVAQDVSDIRPVEDTAPTAAQQRAARQRLGDVLIGLGLLKAHEVQAILSHQALNPRRFGELALSLGLVARADLDLALARQVDVDFEAGAGPEDVERPQGLALPEARQAEVLRAVRSQLLLRWFGEDPEQHTLAIVSDGSGDGRSHICASLARLFARSHEDTLVIDADLRSPRQHALFGLSNRTGLTSYLTREVARAPVRAVRDVPNLHVLTAGPMHPDGLALLERQPFARLLELLSHRYPVILIDTPPASLCSEALTVAVRASGCLLLTRRNRTRLPAVQRLAQSLTRHGVEILGAVVNER